MKVIINFFKKIILFVGNFVNKLIIIPVTKLILIISERFSTSSKKLEFWLSKSNTLLFISLFLALSFFIVIDQKILVFSESSAEVLKNQPLKVTYNEEAYVIKGVPATVDITLIGRRSELMFAKQSTKHDVSIDLTGLKPGTHKINITYKQAIQSIDYKVNPSVVTVVIYPKISELRTLAVDILNKDKLSSKLVIEDVEVDNDKVIIKGAEHELKEVATVKALIDINNLLKQEVGTITLKDVPLRAYNNRGEVVNVEIVPSKMNADIKIASPNREIPIKVIPIGDVEFGKAIDSMILSESKVTAYGDELVLKDLKYIPVEIDVDGLKNDRQFKQELEKPQGVKTFSISNIVIDVKLGKVSNKDVIDIPIEYKNLNELYTAQGLSERDVKIDVSLKGVKSVLDQIQAKDIVAYLDLKGYSEGEHEIEVMVEGTDVRVNYLPKTKKVRIKILKTN